MKNSKSKNRIAPFKKSLTLKQYAGLKYVTIVHIPLIQIGNPYSSVTIRTNSKINESVAKSLLKKGVRIRGIELSFFRKDVLGLSLEKLAHKLKVSTSTVFHWEKEQNKILHPINELAVRALWQKN